MKVEKNGDGALTLELSSAEADQLAGDLIQHAEHLPSAALDLASLLREAKYGARDNFRQPPNPWEPAESVPPAVGKS